MATLIVRRLEPEVVTAAGGAAGSAAGCALEAAAVIQIVETYLVDTEALLCPHVGRDFERARRRGWELYVSAVSLERLGRQRHWSSAVERWMGRLLRDYGNAVLPVDGEIAWLAGRLRKERRSRCESRALIAASALLYDLRIATPCPERYAGWGVVTGHWGRGP